MECKRLEMLPIECVVRGYLSGSGWKSYQESGEVCGIELPAGLQESDKLPDPIFTPTTKAEAGHDEPLTAAQARELVGDDRFFEVERISIELYHTAAEYAAGKGIIIADTKFELGLDEEGTIVLGDEAFTPDSSRFWPADEYEPGGPQPSFDKQFVRDYAESLGWDKTPPGPELPDEVVEGTRSLPRGVRADHRHPVRRLRGEPGSGVPLKATVLVRPKPGILDPQGKAVENSLRHLGFTVDGARVGRVVDLEVESSDPDEARAEVERMCAELLANPLIESYEIELVEGS